MALATLASCGSAATTPDAAPADAYAGPLAYGISIQGPTGYFDGYRDAGITLTVNGEPQTNHGFSASFSTYEEALGASYSLETWFGDALLYRRTESPGGCEGHCSFARGTPTMESVVLGLEASGELRTKYITCNYANQPYCHTDFGWGAACDPLSWTSGGGKLKCGLVLTVRDPLYAYFDAVPAGQVAIGEACHRGAPGPGTGYDDCAAGGVCWQGLCRAMCGEDVTCAGVGICEIWPRMRDRIGWCRTRP